MQKFPMCASNVVDKNLFQLYCYKPPNIISLSSAVSKHSSTMHSRVQFQHIAFLIGTLMVHNSIQCSITHNRYVSHKRVTEHLLTVNKFN